MIIIVKNVPFKIRHEKSSEPSAVTFSHVCSKLVFNPFWGQIFHLLPVLVHCPIILITKKHKR